MVPAEGFRGCRGYSLKPLSLDSSKLREGTVANIHLLAMPKVPSAYCLDGFWSCIIIWFWVSFSSFPPLFELISRSHQKRLSGQGVTETYTDILFAPLLLFYSPRLSWESSLQRGLCGVVTATPRITREKDERMGGHAFIVSSVRTRYA